MTRFRSCSVVAVIALMLAAPGTAAGQRAPGAQGLQVQQGTWVYPVRTGLQAAMLEGREVGSGNGIDGETLARASLRAAYVAAGEAPTCPRSKRADMRGRSRVVAMTVDTGTGTFIGGRQRSRLVVNQALNRAVLYLHGEASEWIPGPSFCDDQKYVLAGRGRGFLRIEYRTASHVTPLNFMAYPSAGDIDTQQLEEACRKMRDLAVDAYQSMNRRWSTISSSYDGPIDWSVIKPVPENFGDGEHASFADGLFNTGDIIQAANGALDYTGLAQNLSNAFSASPGVSLGGVTGIAQWVVMQAAQGAMGAAGIPMVDPIDAMMAMAEMGHAAFQGSENPAARQIAGQGLQRLPGANGPFEGIDADYMIHTLLDACDQPAQQPSDGMASGHFSWGGGTITLNGHGLAPGQPAATAAAPVGAGSVSEALAKAKAMGVAVPDMAKLQGAMPQGVSLDALPAPMTGQAGGGGWIAENAPEWTLSYNVQLVDTGERIAALWFDPRR